MLLLPIMTFLDAKVISLNMSPTRDVFGTLPKNQFFGSNCSEANPSYKFYAFQRAKVYPTFPFFLFLKLCYVSYYVLLIANMQRQRKECVFSFYVSSCYFPSSSLHDVCFYFIYNFF